MDHDHSSSSTPTTWPDLAEGLYSFLTGRRATIEYNFDQFEIFVPTHSKDSAPAAKWKFNGTLRLRTSEAQ